MRITKNIPNTAATDPRNILSLLLGIVIGLLMAGCASGSPTTRFILNQPNQTIGMEVTYREGSIEYSHPADLRPEILDQVLHHIEVQPSPLLARLAGASSIRQEAFTKEERNFLAQNLSKALNQATPLETVTFYWTTPRNNGIWDITSGGLYLQGNTLHVVLPNFRYPVPTKKPPQTPRDHPLSRIGESLHLLKANPPARQLTHGLATELWAPQTPHFVFSLTEMADVQMTNTSQQNIPPIPRQDSSESIKQRLQRLEELRQEELITEAEYQHKRQEILSGL